MIKSVGFFSRGDFYVWGLTQTTSFSKALERQGIRVEHFGTKSSPIREVLSRPREQLPDVTCSLMDLGLGLSSDLLLDHHKVPHVLYSVDLSSYYLHIAFNPYALMTTIDEQDLQKMQSMGFKRTFHLPLGCEKDLQCSLSEDKEYDIVYMGTCWDFETEVLHWKKKLPPNIVDIMIEVCDEVFQGHSQIKAMDYALERRGLKFTEVPFCTMHRQITMYTKGKDRVNLVKSIKKHPVHVFGKHNLKKGWEEFLEGQENVHFHDMVSFSDSIKIMQKSKILLNGAPQFKYGLHERIFNGLGSGALVLTDDNAIMKDHFKDEEDILLYNLNEYDSIEEKISPYLSNTKKRNELVVSGREKVMKNHTWDVRAKHFISSVSQILEKVKSS